MACSRVAQILADCLARDMPACFKYPRRNRGIEVWNISTDELRSHEHRYIFHADHILQRYCLASQEAIVGLRIFDAASPCPGSVRVLCLVKLAYVGSREAFQIDLWNVV